MLKLEFFKNNDICKPPWNYYFLLNLEESEYPSYLAKLFKLKTGEELPLLKEWSFKSCRMGICLRGQGFSKYIIDKKRCKTFNQKIQWIKLYGITPLMRDCTDKVKVRDFVRERIGKEYLKPVLQVVRSEESGVRSNNLNFSLSTLNSPLFDQIDFDKLPDSFVIKCNHGCKWQYIIKNKNVFLNNKRLFDMVKQNITGWLEQDYSLWGGFELNYRGIEPKLLIEPLLRENINIRSTTVNIYCFNGASKIIIKFFDENKMSIYDEKFKQMENIFGFKDEKIIMQPDNIINQSIDLSIKLAKPFNFVRVDWMIYKNKLYFEELTFTPYSGFIHFNKRWNLELGELLNIERIKNEF